MDDMMINEEKKEDDELSMFGWMHSKVRGMLNELNVRLSDYDVTVPRSGSRTIAVQITESARKATEAEQQLLNSTDNDGDNKIKSNDFFSELQHQKHHNPYRNAR